MINSVKVRLEIETSVPEEYLGNDNDIEHYVKSILEDMDVEVTDIEVLEAY